MFKEALDNLYAFAVVVNRHGNIHYVNDYWTRVLGWSQQEMLGRPFLEFIHPDDREESNTIFSLASNGQNKAGLIVRFKDKERNDHWLEWTTSSGENDSVFGTAKLIDYEVRRKQYSQMLEGASTSEKYRLLSKVTEISGAAMMITDDVGAILWANDAYTDMLGWSLDELLGQKQKDLLIGPETDLQVIDRMRVALRTGKSTVEEIKFYRKDGSCFWADFSGSPIFDDGDIKHFVGIINDVDQRITQREQLSEANIKLKESIKAGNVGLWSMNLQTQQVQFSKEYKEQLGYNEDEFKDDIESFRKHLHPEDAEKLHELSSNIIANKESNLEVEFRLRHKNGSYRWILSRASMFYDEQGKPLNAIGSHIDITKLKQLEQQNRQSQKMSAVGQLAGGVAHDINNQLGGISGFAQLLESKLTEPKLKTFVQNIITATESCAKTTKQLLAFSKADHLKIEPFDIHLLIQESMPLLKRFIDRRITINLALNAKQFYVVGDRSALHNTLLNLLLNARDAMPEGGLITITTTYLENLNQDDIPGEFAVQEGPFLQLSFSDSGVGIEREHVDKVFEPFFTTKSPGVGNGLGLSSVYGAIQGMGGAIKVESEKNAGSCFKVWLPLDEAAGIGQDVFEPDIVTTEDEPHLTVLCVDDESMIQDIYIGALDMLGHERLHAYNGAEAVELYRKHWQDIDLVLLDMIMPKMNGKDTFYALKEINPSVKVIFCSGFTGQFSDTQLLEDGALGLLSKPFKIKDLQTWIAKVAAEKNTD